MDDALALELGATIHGAVTDVLVHADGYKKSISSPGVGNYITVAKAVARARRDFGDESVQRRSFVQAHGTGTPQNRTTESQILNGVAGGLRHRGLAGGCDQVLRRPHDGGGRRRPARLDRSAYSPTASCRASRPSTRSPPTWSAITCGSHASRCGARPPTGTSPS